MARATPSAAAGVDLAAVRARDPEALRAFFDGYFPVVFGVAARFLGEDGWAEDVTQEVFLKLYRAADQLDVGRDPRSWVLTITYNACRDAWRSRGYRLSRRTASLDAEPAVAAAVRAPDADPAERAERSERERLVQAALLELDADLRTPVLLHDFGGLGHAEIGEILGVTHAAARKRYSRALAALAEILRGRME